MQVCGIHLEAILLRVHKYTIMYADYENFIFQAAAASAQNHQVRCC